MIFIKSSVGLNLSLEHAAPRMQEVMRKRLDVNILHDNLNYITEKYPHVNLTLNAMHGFPTETEDEALLTLNYIKSIKWLDFPYLHNVRIFPGTEIELLNLHKRLSIKSLINANGRPMFTICQHLYTFGGGMFYKNMGRLWRLSLQGRKRKEVNKLP